MQKGNISVQTENIFPIIKKYLYSDHEIFLRELVANAVDATQKLKALSRRGEATGELGDLTIEIILDADHNTLTVRDRGIGMTEEEILKYLNQVAFSSAHEFLEKYKDDSTIIGNFGLGFYSAFMVAGKVEVITRSYQQDAQAVIWTCEGNPEYTLDNSDKAERGTDVVLHIKEEDKEFLEESRIQGLLDKYCKFLPIPIKFGTRKETTYEGEGEDRKAVETEVDNIINNPEPAWKKQPTELNDEDYRNFYSELYPFSPQPMFWIHLNIDYPFNLTGILYFPKIGNAFEVQKNKIQLYSNQVYVTDDVKEIVPEFLTLLHGVIDSPDIPLNVSRSYLQHDSNVRKISSYITRKVAEKLNDLFKENREDFESKWNDLGVFVKYGMITDEKFYEKAAGFALLHNEEDQYFTIEEYIGKVKPAQTNKYDKIVLLYTNNAADQHAQIEACKTRGYDVLVLDHVIDTHFMQQLEYKRNDVTFVRVDSEPVDRLVETDEEKESVLTEEQENTVKGLFEELVTAAGGTVMLRPMSPEDPPVTITRPEFMRRMKEMQALQGMNFEGLPDTYNLVINTNHPLITEKLIRMRKKEKQQDVAEYLFNLARLGQNMLKGSDLTHFIQKSIDFIK